MMKYNAIIKQALAMRAYAYVPYSGFAVGAALLAKSGKIYGGCNIENAAYTPTNCAERTAFFKAVSEGEREFAAIAIAGGPVESASRDLKSDCLAASGDLISNRSIISGDSGLEKSDIAAPTDYCAPCGVCRQVMAEFCDSDFQIVLAKSETEYRVFTLAELLPESFGPGNLSH